MGLCPLVPLMARILSRVRNFRVFRISLNVSAWNTTHCCMRCSPQLSSEGSPQVCCPTVGNRQHQQFSSNLSHHFIQLVHKQISNRVYVLLTEKPLSHSGVWISYPVGFLPLSPHPCKLPSSHIRNCCFFCLAKTTFLFQLDVIASFTLQSSKVEAFSFFLLSGTLKMQLLFAL